MNNISGKYIKDENGNIISPIANAMTIYYDTNTNLKNKIDNDIAKYDDGYYINKTYNTNITHAGSQIIFGEYENTLLRSGTAIKMNVRVYNPQSSSASCSITYTIKEYNNNGSLINTFQKTFNPTATNSYIYEHSSSNGTTRIQFSAVVENISDCSGATITANIKSSNPKVLTPDSSLFIKEQMGNYFVPLTGDSTINGGLTIGSNSSRTILMVYGSTHLDGISYTDDLVPSTTNTYNLGSSNYYYNNAYINQLYANQIQSQGILNINNADVSILNNHWLDFPQGGAIMFKEDGYGDKFLIYPEFNGTGDSNKLTIKSTTGAAGEDPTSWDDLLYIHADTAELETNGPVNVGGYVRASAYYLDSGSVPTHYHCVWNNTLTAEVGTSCQSLIILNDSYVGIGWVSGSNNNLTIMDIKGDRSPYNIYMSSRTSLTVDRTDNSNFTGTIVTFY